MSASPTLSARLVAQVGDLAFDLQLLASGTLAVIGPNGAGKTTLLSLLLGVHPVKEGRIEVAGIVLLDTASGVDVALEQRKISFVPQDYGLFPHMTVRENVGFALASAEPDLPRRARLERATAMLRDLGVAARAEQYPLTLSGGEKQRVALARALAVNPHDASDARVLAQYIVVLEHGRVTQSGTWQQLVEAPATHFVREFVASAG
jgi:molybdate transport system ATP-binding protein